MKFYSVPADFKLETIDKYDKLNQEYENAKVSETYGNITVGNMFGSGRSVELLPEVDLLRLSEYVEYSNRKNIDFNYTINASHLQNKEFTAKGILEIMSFLGRLHKMGIRWITVALPSLMEIIKSLKYDFKIKASVICQITTPNKARFYKELGVEKIVVDETLNRDFPKLKQIVEVFGDNVEIIVNQICHKDCSSRMFHYNQISTDSIELVNETSAKYYPHRCLIRRFENIGNLLKLTWVRPEDIHFYTAVGINYFKLQGRHIVLKGDPARTIEGYFKESYDGDLLEFLDMFNPTSHFRVPIDNKKLEGFLKPFYEREQFCKDNCPVCNYCESFARKCIDEKKMLEVSRAANEFFRQFDQFTKTIRHITDSSADKEKKEEIEADFDLN